VRRDKLPTERILPKECTGATLRRAESAASCRSVTHACEESPSPGGTRGPRHQGQGLASRDLSSGAIKRTAGRTARSSPQRGLGSPDPATETHRETVAKHFVGVERRREEPHALEPAPLARPPQPLRREEREMTGRLEPAPVSSPEGVPVSGEVGGLDPESPPRTEKLPATSQESQGIVDVLDDMAGGDVLEEAHGKGRARKPSVVDTTAGTARGLGRKGIGLAALGRVAEKHSQAKKRSVTAADVQKGSARPGRRGQMTDEIMKAPPPALAAGAARQGTAPGRSQPVTERVVEKPAGPLLLETAERPVADDPRRSVGRSMGLIADISPRDALGPGSWVEPRRPAGRAGPETPESRDQVQTVLEIPVEERSLAAPTDGTDCLRLKRFGIPPRRPDRWCVCPRQDRIPTIPNFRKGVYTLDPFPESLCTSAVPLAPGECSMRKDGGDVWPSWASGA